MPVSVISKSEINAIAFAQALAGIITKKSNHYNE